MPADEFTRAQVAYVYGAPFECSIVSVSENDPQYARFDYDKTTCDPAAYGDGFGIARFDGAGWIDIWQASEDSTPCPSIPIPTDVGLELQACRKPSSRTVINKLFGIGGDQAASKPTKLPIGAHALFDVKWSGWTKSVATGRGVLDYSDRTAKFRKPIKMTASGRKLCGSTYAYTRVVVKAVKPKDARQLRPFTGTVKLGCPE